MTDPDRMPTWGLLVNAPVEQVMRVLRALGDPFEHWQLLYRKSGTWTAVFNMEPGPTSDDTAAQSLKNEGLVPVYHFDFGEYEFFTWRWNGSIWVRDSQTVLAELGIDIPGLARSQPSLRVTNPVRVVSVLEGASIEEAQHLAPDLRVESGSHGAIVYDADVESRIELRGKREGRTVELEFDPRYGDFHVRIMRGDECLGTYHPGATRTYDGTPFLADVFDETAPDRILELFGVDHRFLDRLHEDPRFDE